MEQHKFRNNRSYVRAQRTITLRKIEQNSHRSFVRPETVEAIRKQHRFVFGSHVRRGLCHGVRRGVELDLFQSALGGDWIGTEIVKELCDEKRILNMDFSRIRQEWIGSFDAIYSNSLDHARDPYKTVKAWLACLSSDGRLYVEWTEWHDKLGKRGNLADCFSASANEYYDLFFSAGRIINVLDVPGKVKRTIFVVH